MSIISLTHLSDRHLHASVKKARQTEHTALFDVLAHVGEIDRRRAYRDLGHSSIFRYCVDELGYSSSAAGRRIQTARCIRKFPEIGRLLRRHEVNLTTVDQVAGILNESNKDHVIPRIRFKSEREVQAVVARYRPSVELRDRVKSVVVRVPVVEQVVSGSAAPADTSGLGLCEKDNYSRSESVSVGTIDTDRLGACKKDADSRSGSVCVSDAKSSSSSNGSITQTRIARRVHIQFLAEPEFMDKYNDAKAILSNRYPNASFATVFDALLEDFLERRCAKRRERRRSQKHVEKPRARQTTRRSRDNGSATKTRQAKSVQPAKRANKTETSRYIPARVRDRVLTRDGGRCTYTGSNGKRCTQTRNLQIDHIKPYARGGTNAASNLRVLCRVHNQLVAETAFGSEHMKQFVQTE